MLTNQKTQVLAEEKGCEVNKKRIAFFITILAIIIITLITALGKSWSELADRSFEEGNVNGSSKVVTVSNDWLVFDTDDFLTNPGAESRSFSNIYYELYQNGLVKASEGDLSKIYFEKQISVKEDGTSADFFVVGGYYITAPQ